MIYNLILVINFIQREWGSLGKAAAPLVDWKNAVLHARPEENICKLEVATDSLFNYHNLKEEIDLDNVFPNEGPVEEDVYLTATSDEVEKMAGVESTTSPAKQAKLNVANDSKIPRCAEIDQWFDQLVAIRKTAKKSDKVAPLLEAATMEATFKKKLEGGVNSSGKEKAAQLEVHERLHRSYEAGKLKKTSLAYFLKFIAPDCHRILK